MNWPQYDDDGPGTVKFRFHHIYDEMEKRFPTCQVSSAPPEPLWFAQIDAMIAENKALKAWIERSDQ